MLPLGFQRDHFEFAPDHYLFKLLQVENLLLQFGLRLLQIAHDLFVGAHVAQDADGADHLAIRVAQRRCVQAGRDDLTGGAARVQTRIAGCAALDHFAQGSGKLAGLFGADEARKGLLQYLVGAKA